MLVPGTPSDRIQFIDVRDVARFNIDAVERGITGTFNLVSPPGRFTMGELINTSIASARAVTHERPATPTWIPADFLKAHDPAFPEDLPIWAPATGDTAGLAETSATRAIQAGLHVLPIEQTVRDTLVWHLSRPRSEQTQLKAGLPATREQDILRAWHGAHERA